MSEMITLTIDGKSVQAKEGETASFWKHIIVHFTHTSMACCR